MVNHGNAKKIPFVNDNHAWPELRCLDHPKLPSSAIMLPFVTSLC